MARYDYTLKIILLGDFTVNKGALIRSLGELSPTQLSPTQQVWCLKPSRMGLLEMVFVRPDDRKVRAKIQETAGQERFRSVTSSFYRGAHGCLLLFDVTKKATFDGISDWLQELEKQDHWEEMVIALAGCNCHVTGNQRQVTSSIAQEFANHVGLPYDEISVEHIKTFVDLLEKTIDKILLNASRNPTLSTSILPLEQKMEDKSKEESKEKCGC